MTEQATDIKVSLSAETLSAKALIRTTKLYSLKEKLQDSEAYMLMLLNNSVPEAIFENKATRTSVVVLSTEFRISIYGNNLTILNVNENKKQTLIVDCPFTALKSIHEHLFRELNLNDLDSSLTFKGGLIGYLGFGMTEVGLNIKKQSRKFIDIEDSVFFVAGSFIEVNHKTKTAYYVSSESSEACLKMQNAIASNPIEPSKLKSKSLGISPDVISSISKEEYIEKVEQAKEHIKNGEAFQIVLSQRFSTPMPAETIEAYRELRSQSNSMYNYYFNFGPFEYFGASPESFIRIENRRVSFKALAGTRARGEDEASDRALEKELRLCPKENAEHLMLVDLGRNDLGRVCRSGTISVGKIAEVLRYPNVMHLSTDLKGELESNVDSFAAIKSCFPRGTVSGAPKRRALEILSELETEQRGIYSGCAGTIDSRGNVDMAIAIRSATVKDRIAHIQAGAGIVYDSIPEKEYEETIHKAGAILRPLESLRRNEMK